MSDDDKEDDRIETELEARRYPPDLPLAETPAPAEPAPSPPPAPAPEPAGDDVDER